MDYGVQFTSSRKFLTISPIVLWVLTWSLVISTQPLLKQSYILISRRYIDVLYKPALCGLHLVACSSGSGVHAMWKQHVDGIIWKLLVPLALTILHKFSKTLTTSLSLQVYSCQFLHKIRPHTFPGEHVLPPQRPPPQAASVSRSSDIWDQQILTELTEHWSVSTVVDLLTVRSFQKLTSTDCPVLTVQLAKYVQLLKVRCCCCLLKGFFY